MDPPSAGWSHALTMADASTPTEKTATVNAVVKTADAAEIEFAKNAHLDADPNVDHETHPPKHTGVHGEDDDEQDTAPTMPNGEDRTHLEASDAQERQKKLGEQEQDRCEMKTNAMHEEPTENGRRSPKQNPPTRPEREPPGTDHANAMGATERIQQKWT